MDKPIAAFRGETIKCVACSRSVTRKSRQQRYCSDRCRQYALRENKARTAIKNDSGYQDSGPVTNPHFLSNKNNSLHGAKSGSSIPLNILGGYRWPGARKLNQKVRENILRAEIGPLQETACD
jgi:endogenous inhibitor of DNA gyrase (YacG/DUF329 family)